MPVEAASLFVSLSLENQMSGALQRAERDLGSFGSNVNRSLSAIGELAGRAATAIGGVFGAGVAINAAARYERTLTNIQTVLGDTGQEAARINRLILNTTQDSTFGAQQLVDAYYEIVSAVQDVTTHEEILTRGARAATAGQADLQATISSGVAIVNSYGLAAEEISHVYDVLTQTVAVGTGTMDQFGAAMGPVANLMSTVGVDLDNFGAAMAYITSQGATTGAAATRLQSLAMALLRPNVELQRMLSDMGYGSGIELVAQHAGDLGSALQELATHAGGVENLSRALGRAEAIQGAFALATREFSDFQADFKENLSGATERAYATQITSVSARFDRLKAALSGVVVELGQKFLPIVGFGIDLFHGLITALGPTNAGLLAMAVGFVSITAAARPFMPLIRSFIGSFTGLLPILLLVGGAVAGMKAIWESNFLGIRNVVNNVGNQIIRPLRRLFLPIRRAFENLFSGEGSIGDRLRTFFQEALPRILSRAGVELGNIGRALWSGIQQIAVNIGEAWPGVRAAIEDFVQRIGPAIGNFFSTTLPSFLGPILESVGNWIGENAGSLLEGISDWITGAWDWLRTDGVSLFESGVRAVFGIIQTIGNWIGENAGPLLESISDWITVALKWLTTDGAALLESGVRAAFGVVQNIGNWIGENAPKFIEALGDFFAGAINWLNETGGPLLANVLGLTISESFGEDGKTFTRIRNENGLIPTLERIFEGAANWVSEQATRILDSIFSFLGSKEAQGYLSRIQNIINSFFASIATQLAEIKLPDELQTIANIFITPLVDAFDRLSNINWTNVVIGLLAAAVAFVGLSFAFRLLKNIVAFNLLTQFLEKLDAIVQAIRDNDISGVLRNLSGAIVTLGGALFLMGLLDLAKIGTGLRRFTTTLRTAFSSNTVKVITTIGLAATAIDEFTNALEAFQEGDVLGGLTETASAIGLAISAIGAATGNLPLIGGGLALSLVANAISELVNAVIAAQEGDTEEFLNGIARGLTALGVAVAALNVNALARALGLVSGGAVAAGAAAGAAAGTAGAAAGAATGAAGAAGAAAGAAGAAAVNAGARGLIGRGASLAARLPAGLSTAGLFLAVSGFIELLTNPDVQAGLGAWQGVFENLGIILGFVETPEMARARRRDPNPTIVNPQLARIMEEGIGPDTFLEAMHIFGIGASEPLQEAIDAGLLPSSTLEQMAELGISPNIRLDELVSPGLLPSEELVQLFEEFERTAAALIASGDRRTRESRSSGFGGWSGSLVVGGDSIPLYLRARGGPVWPGVFRVGENNAPELLQQGNRLYLIPGERGNVVPMTGMSTSSQIVINGPITIEGVQDYQSLLNGLKRAAHKRNAHIMVRGT